MPLFPSSRRCTESLALTAFARAHARAHARAYATSYFRQRYPAVSRAREKSLVRPVRLDAKTRFVFQSTYILMYFEGRRRKDFRWRRKLGTRTARLISFRSIRRLKCARLKFTGWGKWPRVPPCLMREHFSLCGIDMYFVKLLINSECFNDLSSTLLRILFNFNRTPEIREKLIYIHSNLHKYNIIIIFGLRVEAA